MQWKSCSMYSIICSLFIEPSCTLKWMEPSSVIYSTNNDVRVAISYANEGHQTRLLGLAVNSGWETIPIPPDPHVLASGGERSIVDNLGRDPDLTQLDLVHAEKEALFKPGGEGMPRD